MEFLASVWDAIMKEASEFALANLLQHEIFVEVLDHTNPVNNQKFLTLMEKIPEVVAVVQQPDYFGHRFYKLYLRSPDAAFCAIIECWFAHVQPLRLLTELRGYEFNAQRMPDGRVRCYYITDPAGKERSFPVPGDRVLDGVTYTVTEVGDGVVDITRVW
jgi:hypothetical protein